MKSACVTESVVPVAGLRVPVVGAGDVVATQFGSQRAHRRTASIVEDVGLMGVPQRERRAQRLPHQLDVLVVRRDEHVNRQIGFGRHDTPASQVPQLVEIKEERDEAVQFRKVHQQGEGERVEIDGVDGAVGQVRGIDHERKGRHRGGCVAPDRCLDIDEGIVCVERRDRGRGDGCIGCDKRV
jgi:hypothetical protein